MSEQPQQQQQHGYIRRDNKDYFRFRNGVEAEIQHVPPLLLAQIEKAVPMPVPPVVKFDRGDGVEIEEVNEAAPEYEAALRKRNQLINEKQDRFALLYGVELTVDTKAVKRLREFTRREVGIELDPDDKYLYVSSILLTGTAETNDLYRAITDSSQPTEEAVAAAKQTFQPDIQAA